MEFLNNTFSFIIDSRNELLTGLVIFFVSYSALKIAKQFIKRYLKKLSSKTVNNFDDFIVSLLSNISHLFYLVIPLYTAFLPFQLDPTVETGLFFLFLITIVYEITKSINAFFDYVANLYTSKVTVEKKEKEQAQVMVKTISVLVHTFNWLMAIIIVLSTLGINVTSLITGLGIGGIAIALAVQTVLGDVISSFSIFTDKPFKVGDFIVIGDSSGTVEQIGIKTTRIRSLSGQQLVVPNKELTSSKVENFQQLDSRTAIFTLGVVYGLPTSKLENIPALVKNIVEQQQKAVYNRCHFISFGDSALNFEIAITVQTKDYVEYLDIMQIINIGIYNIFEIEEIDFAYPTQTLFVQK
jgi:small-conductance mechanosensitive channel